MQVKTHPVAVASQQCTTGDLSWREKACRRAARAWTIVAVVTDTTSPSREVTQETGSFGARVGLGTPRARPSRGAIAWDDRGRGRCRSPGRSGTTRRRSGDRIDTALPRPPLGLRRDLASRPPPSRPGNKGANRAGREGLATAKQTSSPAGARGRQSARSCGRSRTSVRR